MKFEIDWFNIAVAYRAAYRAVQAHGDWEDLMHPIMHALLDQLRADPRGASLPKDLGEALEMLLASHAYATRPWEPNERYLLAPYLKTKPESTYSSPVNIGIGDPPPKPPPPPPSVVEVDDPPNIKARFQWGARLADAMADGSLVPWPFDGETPHQTVARLMREKNEVEARYRDLQASLDEALNSGDGSYKP